MHWIPRALHSRTASPETLPVPKDRWNQTWRTPCSPHWRTMSRALRAWVATTTPSIDPGIDAFIPGIFSFLYFYKHDPQLIERRLQSKEQISEQKLTVRLLKLVLFVAFLPGLDYRLGWSRTTLDAVPLWLMLFSHALVLGSVLSVVWVMKANSFALRTIRVEVGQRVLSTGPYRMVRHPMYLGSLVMWLSTALALGSYFAWPAFALLIPFYVFRLLNEEKALRRELPWLSRILPPHALPARPLGLVRLEARRSEPCCAGFAQCR
jgi:protein-S-isoprenylcysteine O-methyltransferase Ste14